MHLCNGPQIHILWWYVINAVYFIYFFFYCILLYNFTLCFFFYHFIISVRRYCNQIYLFFILKMIFLWIPCHFFDNETYVFVLNKLSNKILFSLIKTTFYSQSILLDFYSFFHITLFCSLLFVAHHFILNKMAYFD